MAVRGTTPTFKLKFSDEEVDLTQALNVYATFKNLNTVITKTGDDIEVAAKEVDVYLSQEETLSFEADTTVEVQVNWTYAEGRRAASKVKYIKFGKNLIGSVLE